MAMTFFQMVHEMKNVPFKGRWNDGLVIFFRQMMVIPWISVFFWRRLHARNLNAALGEVLCEILPVPVIVVAEENNGVYNIATQSE